MKLLKTVFAVLLLCLLPIGFTEAANTDIVRVGVIPFTSKASGVYDQDAAGITDIFTRYLASSKKLVLVEREQLNAIAREQKLSASGLVDPDMAVEIGRLAGCQFMIVGAVTEASARRTSFRDPFFGIVINETEASAGIDMRIFSVTTSEIVLAISEKGSVSESSFGGSFGGIPIPTVIGGEYGNFKSAAIAQAAWKLANRIKERLVGEYSQVIQNGGSKAISINLGDTSGARKDDLYLIYCDGREMLDIDGTSLGFTKENVAIIKLANVSGGFSIGEVVPSGGTASLIQRGDKIEPITKKESAALAKKSSFISKRPPKRSSVADLLRSDSTSATPDPLPSMSPDPQPSTSPAPVSSPQPVTSPTPAVTSTPQTDGFDPNNSTDTKVIGTYGLDPGTANMLSIKHRASMNLFNSGKFKDAYAAFSGMVDDYAGNYLAAYWAGVSAQKLKKNDESLQWIDKALSINPNYQPAADFKKKTLKK